MVHVAQPGDVVRGILERPSDAYYLHIPVKLWANFCDEHKTSSAALPELRPVHFESNHQLHALLQTIEHDVTSPHAIGPLFREGLCLSVMALLRDRYSSESNAARPAGCSGMGAKQIKHVHEFIQANLAQPISLAQLAAPDGRLSKRHGRYSGLLACRGRPAEAWHRLRRSDVPLNILAVEEEAVSREMHHIDAIRYSVPDPVNF